MNPIAPAHLTAPPAAAPRDGLGVLSEAVLALRRTGEPGTAWTIAGEGAARALGAAEFRLLCLDARSGTLRLLEEGGIETPYLAEPGGPVDGVLRRELAWFDDGIADPHAEREALLWTIPAAAVAAVPLFSRDGLFGCFVLAWAEPHPFPPEERRLLQTLADAVAFSIERAGLQRALEAERQRRVELERRVATEEEASSHVMSVVAHEIRTPLTAIKAYTETLLETLHHPNPPRERFLGIINEECDRLARLVADVLDLSRLEAGRRPLRMSEFPLRDVVTEVTGSLQPLARARHVEFAVSADPGLVVEGDRDLLHRLFVNLVSNALKYSPVRGQVRIAVTADGDSWSGSVEDDGPGIPPAELSRVFERFYRVRRPNDTSEGTGLGLAIVRGIVELHGGRVWAESPGAGTRFAVTLPRRQMASAVARRIARTVLGRDDLRRLLDATVAMVSAVMDAEIVSLMVVDPDRGDLFIAASRGLEGARVGSRRTTVRSGVAGTVAAWAQPLLVDNIETDRRFQRMNHPQYRTKSLLSVPVVVEGEVLGVVNVNNKRSAAAFDEHDLGVLGALVERVGGAIERAAAHPDSAHTVDQAIEAIHSVTRLHAEGTLGPRHHARHARRLAGALGLSEQEIDLIGYVGAIHDVGMEPLRARLDALPAPLPPAERERVSRHPESGVEILRPLEYVTAARELVLAHHERWDGTGYPRGLAGEAIPLGARVLAVVDAWESMVDGRPYRPARTREDAIAELKHSAGTQFDPRVVDAFVEMIGREGGAA